MRPEELSSYLAAQARAHDPDRYLAALFAPGERRDAVFALALLDRELARVPGSVSQPMAGLIRCQWWRDALEELAAGQPPRRHPIVEALAAAGARGWLDPAALQALVDARERPLEEPIPSDAAAFEAQAAATGGLVQAETHRALGGSPGRAREAARAVGTGLELTRLLRALPPGQPAPAAFHAILDRAAALLTEARAAVGRPPRAELAAFLPARLAAADADRLRRSDGAVAAAATSRPPTALLGLLWAWSARRP